MYNQNDVSSYMYNQNDLSVAMYNQSDPVPIVQSEHKVPDNWFRDYNYVIWRNVNILILVLITYIKLLSNRLTHEQHT